MLVGGGGPPAIIPRLWLQIWCENAFLLLSLSREAMTQTSFLCACGWLKWWHCVPRTSVRCSLAVTIFVLPSFSLFSCEGTGESRAGRLPKEAGPPRSWNFYKPSRKRRGARSKKGRSGEKKWEIILNSIFYSACFCFLSCPLLKTGRICPPSLAGGNCGVGRPYCLEDREGVGGGGHRVQRVQLRREINA